jgi:lipocalin
MFDILNDLVDTLPLDYSLIDQIKDIPEKLKGVQDSIVVGYYKDFVGEKEVEKLVKQFDVNKFCRRWEQVLTSRSTALFGRTGLTSSSVYANYTLEEDGNVGVFNNSFDGDFNNQSITGVSRARDPTIPTCRTVKFDSLNPAFEGDYWILYISPDFNTVVVGSPLITPYVPIKITDNFALYVLAANREAFWASDKNYTEVSKVLKKYGFTNPINKGYFSGKSFSL